MCRLLQLVTQAGGLCHAWHARNHQMLVTVTTVGMGVGTKSSAGLSHCICIQQLTANLHQGKQQAWRCSRVSITGT